ncbi:MAG TPA: archaeosortase/exosortase family protein, partial [Opitutales bacterium]|nr:archaeosortase/exosortase family protein [Opitutales bacterium]
MNFARLPPALKYAAFACAALAAWITFDLSHWWRMKEDYSFGFLVPIFSFYVIFERWERIRELFAPVASPATQARPIRWMDNLGFAALLASLMLFVFGALYRGFTGPTLPGSLAMTLGFSGTVLSAAMVFSDRR